MVRSLGFRNHPTATCFVFGQASDRTGGMNCLLRWQAAHPRPAICVSVGRAPAELTDDPRNQGSGSDQKEKENQK